MIKKLNKWLYGAMALSMFAACSSDDAPNNKGGKEPGDVDGYLAVTINLPTQPSTRAANDQFDDGTANEYAVNDACLILFQGDTEADATFKAAYDLGLGTPVNDDTENPADNITTSYRKAIQVSKATSGSLWGLVFVNYKNKASITIQDNKLIIGQKTFSETDKFSDLLNLTTTDAFYITTDNSVGGFFMANAPLYIKGDSQTVPSMAYVQTLVNLGNSLHKTENLALASPAGNIYVERAVAKATFNVASNLATLHDRAITDVKWCIDNTESETYIVRKMTTPGVNDYMGFASDLRSNVYRFAGNVAMGITSIQPEEANKFRTYWCVDPHYGLGDNESLTSVVENANFVAAGEKPLYCHENTFPVESQNWRNTTRAIVSAKIGNATFYTINEDETTIYEKLADAESYSIKYILESKAIKEAVAAANKIPENGSETGSAVTITTENYTQYLSINWERNNNTGMHEVASIKFIEDAPFNTTPSFSEEDSEKLCGEVNSYYRISEYLDGISYYDIRFKHFAGSGPADQNDLAPWDPSQITSANTPTTAEAYAGADAAKNWLGRYGMVRNNWYDITVSGFTKLGKPAVGGLTVTDVNKPDDEKNDETWIAFRVNLLSWAKRTQQHEF